MDPMQGWRSRNQRELTTSETVLRRSDGTELRARLADVSRDGCRLELAQESLKIGEWIELATSPEQFVSAQVRWALGTSAGVRFLARSD